MKTTHYFDTLHRRPDRATIKLDWIQQVIDQPLRTEIQPDGRIRKWAAIEAFGNRVLRVILLEDGATVHNAFFDRGFKP